MESSMWLILIILWIVIISVAAGVWRLRASRKASPPGEWRSSIVGTLLSLEEEPLEELFQLYRQQFGPGAARYARHTYEEWKNGQVNPNRKTFNRLTVYLPTVM